MLVSLIVAASENNVIGNKGTLPWPRLEADMQHFRTITEGHPVIMGRKTFESIGHALPDRRNIVISKTLTSAPTGCALYPSLHKALIALGDEPREVFIIGGGEIYREALDGRLVHRIYFTRVHGTFKGDISFPALGEEWGKITSKPHTADQKNPYPYTFEVYERKK